MNFWEQLITYYSFTTMYYYEWEGFMKYAVGLVSGAIIYIPRFMLLGSGIQVILRLLSQQFEKL
jgi:hypothetical protein